MNQQITYAKAGGPPDDWHDLRIIHADGTDDTYVVEANSAEGWLIRYRRDGTGKPIVENGELLTERLDCAFTIERKS